MIRSTLRWHLCTMHHLQPSWLLGTCSVAQQQQQLQQLRGAQPAAPHARPAPPRSALARALHCMRPLLAAGVPGVRGAVAAAAALPRPQQHAAASQRAASSSAAPPSARRLPSFINEPLQLKGVVTKIKSTSLSGSQLVTVHVDDASWAALRPFFYHKGLPNAEQDMLARVARNKQHVTASNCPSWVKPGTTFEIRGRWAWKDQYGLQVVVESCTELQAASSDGEAGGAGDADGRQAPHHAAACTGACASTRPRARCPCPAPTHPRPNQPPLHPRPTPRPCAQPSSCACSTCPASAPRARRSS